MDSELDGLKAEVTKTKDIASVAGSEGGKRLTAALAGDAVNIARLLGTGYKTMSQTELIAWCANLGEKMNMLSILYGAESEYEQAASDLKEALKQTLE